MLRFLTLFGLVLQLAGAAVTGWGARLIWRQAATGGERLVDPALSLMRRTWQRAINILLRWMGRPSSRTVQGSGVASATAATSAGLLSKGYSPLPADLPLNEMVAELDQRTQALRADIDRSESQLLDKMKDQARRHDELSQAFGQYMSEQDENAKRRDRRGIRFEAAGLALVTIGAILQAFGSLLAPTPVQ